MKPDYSRKIIFLCPICGGDQFSYDNNIPDGDVTCNSCRRTFTRQELIEQNQDNISVKVKEVGAEVLRDVTKDFQKMIKDLNRKLK